MTLAAGRGNRDTVPPCDDYTYVVWAKVTERYMKHISDATVRETETGKSWISHSSLD